MVIISMASVEKKKKLLIGYIIEAIFIVQEANEKQNCSISHFQTERTEQKVYSDLSINSSSSIQTYQSHSDLCLLQLTLDI